jgi:hypothetical protein
VLKRSDQRAVVWLVFGSVDRIGLWGASGLAADLVPTTFMITMMMTFGLTRFTRIACAAARWAPLAARAPAKRLLLRAGPRCSRPSSRAALVGSCRGCGRGTGAREVLWFKIAYGIALGLIWTP